MKILLVTARYLPHRGGLESVVQHLAQEFVGQGHTVRIITNRYPRTLPTKEVIEGVPVTRLHFLLPNIRYLREGRLDLWMAGIWYRYNTRQDLSRIILEFQPDVINNHYLNEVADLTERSLAASSYAKPWIISLHGGDVDGEPYLSPLNKQRFQRLSRQADGLTACSGFLAAQAVELEPALQGKVTVIHNGVDVERFSTVKPYLYDSPYVIAVGQLVPHKGFDLLIRAFARVAHNYPRCQLLIAGEGPERSALETIIRQEQLGTRAKLLGKVDEAQVASLMAGSLFVAMPSQREPFGIVALEAMAAGKPLLATPVGGLPEFVPVPPNRLVPAQTADWVVALDEWLRLSLEGRLDAEGNYEAARGRDWSTVAASYLQVYMKAASHV